MILFNAPVQVDDHQLQAIRMALEMREAVAVLAKGWKKHGYGLGFGVGIAGGYATIGAIGYEGRLEYTAIGTVVNLAARLCDEARDSRSSYRRDVEPVGELSLKGFNRAVPAYNVLGMREHRAP